ncbi:MAG: N-acetyl-gamma-glutamyl-phosphate reductase [Spirochaetaceae bacterium]|nr:MAG: N-acetyl-gamma-glutamyl-phosphate reductase [Spirochaetaceae bacterium]
MRVCVLGATGYAGASLLRILAEHSEIKEIFAVSGSVPGTKVLDHDPALTPRIAEKMQSSHACFVDLQHAAGAGCDAIFSALPHLESAKMCAPFFGNSVVLDLSADLRIKDPTLFEASYNTAPPRPDLLDTAVYGLSEINHEQIRSADIIAVPGCYPTATLLPLIPPAAAGLVRGTAVVNALSGISGAGRKAKIELLYVERTENLAPYLPGATHRHWGEIKQGLDRSGTKLDLVFTPHLVPVKQGMLITTVIELSPGASLDAVRDSLEQAYAGKPCIHLLENTLPETRMVRGTNRCVIALQEDRGRLMLFSAIDNLIKGAAGQAVQNMNIRFGLPETCGLPLSGEV